MDPADALASLLLTAEVPAGQIPPGLEARMALWRDRLAERQLLLILDDAASSEQVRPLLPGAGGSLVLVTSRRHLSALEDATIRSNVTHKHTIVAGQSTTGALCAAQRQIGDLHPSCVRPFGASMPVHG